MILHRYFAWRFAVTFLWVFMGLTAMIVLLDMIELISDLNKTTASTGFVLYLSMLHAPQVLYQILPLIIILSSIALFLGLSRTSELVVARAAGRSALRALIGPAFLTFVLGALAVSMGNPIVAATSKKYDALRNQMLGHSPTVNTVGRNGIWLRQGDENGQTVIHAEIAVQQGRELKNVTFLNLTPDGSPTQRIDAKTAVLQNGGWTASDVKIWPLNSDNPERDSRNVDTFFVPSFMTLEQIRESFDAPSTIPIWQLPKFIDQLQNAGFSSATHQVQFHSELAQPMFLTTMLLIGAGYTMRPQRGGRTGLMTLLAVLSGFTLYFIRNFAMILGNNGQIPVLLAAWAPSIAALCLALAMLLHQEDG